MEKPRYEVLEKSFIGGALLEAGQEVVFEGFPGSKLKPLNDAAFSAKSAAKGRGSAQVNVAAPYQEDGDQSDDDATDDLDKLRDEYEHLFGERPHHNAKAATLSEKISERRKELGV